MQVEITCVYNLWNPKSSGENRNESCMITRTKPGPGAFPQASVGGIFPRKSVLICGFPPASWCREHLQSARQNGLLCDFKGTLEFWGKIWRAPTPKIVILWAWNFTIRALLFWVKHFPCILLKAIHRGEEIPWLLMSSVIVIVYYYYLCFTYEETVL